MNNLFSNPRFNFTLVVVLIFTQIKLIHDNTNIYILAVTLIVAVIQAYSFIDNMLRELKTESGSGSGGTVGVDGRMIPSQQK